MLNYVLIGLSLALTGVAAMQLMYLFYLDRIDKERKKMLREVERRCRSLARRLEEAERRIAEQDELIASLYEEDDDGPWADVLDDG
jgi:single-stranded DNA-specific DHH superfamily exonuclease